MTRLSVNVNKVALLRNTRVLHGIPSVTGAARTAIEAGAYGVTVHPRPDQRHITPGDVDDLADMLKDYPEIEYNIEGNPFHQVMDIVRKVRPTQADPGPRRPGRLHIGPRVGREGQRRKPQADHCGELRDLGCRVSLFMDADLDQIDRVPDIGADPDRAVHRALWPWPSRKDRNRCGACSHPLQRRRNGPARSAWASTPATISTWTTWRCSAETVPGRARGLHRPRAGRRRAGHGAEKTPWGAYLAELEKARK